MDKSTLKNIVEHDGDCSCYMVDCDICDCGALRKKVHNVDAKDGYFWYIWHKHFRAIEKSTRT